MEIFSPRRTLPARSSSSDVITSWIILYDVESKLNQDYIRYEQVEKRQTYHLAEDAREEFDEEFEVHTCDMRSPTFAREVGDALREIGFAILDGTGIDPTLYDEAEKKIVEMFERLTLDEKMRFRAQRHGSVNQGYFPIHETSKQHPDLVEGWVFCRRAFDFPSPGPSGHPLPVGEGSREHEPSPLGEGAAERRVRGGAEFWPLQDYE